MRTEPRTRQRVDPTSPSKKEKKKRPYLEAAARTSPRTPVTVSKQIGQRAESPAAPTQSPLPPTAREAGAGAEGEVRRPVCHPKLGSPRAGGLVRNDRPRPAPFFRARAREMGGGRVWGEVPGSR
uniref:Uncharacterized protein n=1 Tax=Triticum urartu TaxID=4572 RepID=A0A8R7TK35_TRIUA